MRFDFIVLGATGMQGRIVSKDLLENGYSVLMCGRDMSKLNPLLNHYRKSSFSYVDIHDKKRTKEVIKRSGANVLINCVEGDWNDEILKMCAETNVHSIDLGSDIPMTKKQFAMHAELKKKGLTHITGCGSVPGIGNVMLRYAKEKFDKVDDIDVGFAWDSNIKKFVVPFSIQSILEEFVTPADMIVDNKKIQLKPMDTVVRAFHKGVGKENCFNVGHHPETYTFYEYCKDKKIKTVKFYAGFPDHSYDKIQAMVDLGLNSTEALDYRGTKVIPVNFLTELMKRVQMPKGYKEVENLWVNMEGKKGTKKRAIKMECIVHTLPGWEDAGSNIDTGMPASIMAQMVKNGTILERGSFSPEFVVPVQPFFKELAKRKMQVYENGNKIN